eukprot:SAG31_NODE_17073_length_684_cov_1.316239_1_plen_103_part_01
MLNLRPAGIPANKGAAIATLLAAWGVATAEAVLVDDSAGNVASAEFVCDTLWLPRRVGMGSSAMDYIEKRAVLKPPQSTPSTPSFTDGEGWWWIAATFCMIAA